MGHLIGYMKELVRHKRAQPGNDVISGLATTEGLDDDEAAMDAGMLWPAARSSSR